MTEHATPNHKERAHALLSASGAHIWLNCTPAARLQDKFADEETEFSAEGTKAHELCEILLIAYRDGTPVPEGLDYPEEMWECANQYVEVVKGIVEPLRAAGELVVILVEVKVDYSRWAPEGFGTGDCLILTKRKAWCVDYKHGKGVRVDVTSSDQSTDPDEDEGEEVDEEELSEEVTNEQLRIYALGTLEDMKFVFEGIEEFELVIVQPRLNNIAHGCVSTAELEAWAEGIVVPQAALAWKGEGEFVPGGHCGFCKARRTCRARAEYLREKLRAINAPKDPNLMTAKEVASILGELPAVIKWATELRKWAVRAAVDGGVRFEGFKTVEGRSNRFVSDQDEAIVILADAGFPSGQTTKPTKLLGITALEKLVGKKKLATLLSDLIVKPRGKPTLVPESDKRPIYSPTRSADDDFKE